MSVSALGCSNAAVVDLWHPIVAIPEIKPDEEHRTVLLEEPLTYGLDRNGSPVVRRRSGVSLPVTEAYGYVWTTMGTPRRALFAIPEYDELDRRRMNAGTIGVNVSAPRAVENFLDMGHFPFVHTAILGDEPFTEVVEYEVDVDPVTNEVWARNCRFYQPMAAATATEGQVTAYTYRIPHPYCVLLYKSYPVDPRRMDVIGLFLQAVDQENVRAHNFLCMIDEINSDTQMRAFQHMIFGQDKPILENQVPKRLPLDPRAEIPIRADKSSIAYRRWLTELGVTYAVIPAE